MPAAQNPITNETIESIHGALRTAGERAREDRLYELKASLRESINEAGFISQNCKKKAKLIWILRRKQFLLTLSRIRENNVFLEKFDSDRQHYQTYDWRLHRVLNRPVNCHLPKYFKSDSLLYDRERRRELLRDIRLLKRRIQTAELSSRDTDPRPVLSEIQAFLSNNDVDIMEDGSLLVELGDIFLEGVFIGHFRYELKLNPQIEIKVINTCEDITDRLKYPHPHVHRNGELCLGEASNLYGIIAQGFLNTAHLIITNLLNTYNRNSPYILLDAWEQDLEYQYCVECGERLGPDDCYEVDGETYCGECCSPCHRCHSEYRFDALILVAGNEYCSDCLNSMGYHCCTYCGEYFHLDSDMSDFDGEEAEYVEDCCLKCQTLN